MWVQKVEAEPHSAGCTGPHPWWEVNCQMAETSATFHPRAPAPCSSPPVLIHHKPWSAVDPHHLLPAWGKPSWESEKGTFTAPSLCDQMSAPVSSTAWCPLPSWPWAFYHHAHFLCHCPQASFLSNLTQGWVLVHLHGAGVSELAWTGECCPARVSRIQRELSWQHLPWGSQTKSITVIQYGPCSGTTAFPLHSVPRKAHPVRLNP